jgi:hypothetical protein
VLTLRPGDIVDTQCGVGQVRGWTWDLNGHWVRLRVIVLRTERRHHEVFGEDAVVRCWRR